MSLSYTLRESVSGFKRTKLSSVISIMTVSISLLLLGIFAVITINASRFITSLRNKVELEAFLQEPITDEETAGLLRSVEAIPGIATVTYISKDQAAKIFREEFGEDISSVLDFNPLPPSFKITLRDGFKTGAGVRAISEQVSSMKGVESVTYRKALLELIDQRTAAVHNITLGLGVLISLSAILLVSNTIRLAIYAKRKLIRTMELVGATGTFIRLPFLLEGVVQGLLGGVVAAGILYAVLEHSVRLFSTEFAAFVHMEPTFYLIVVAAGILLGFVGSIISVIRFIPHAAAGG